MKQERRLRLAKSMAPPRPGKAAPPAPAVLRLGTPLFNRLGIPSKHLHGEREAIERAHVVPLTAFSERQAWPWLVQRSLDWYWLIRHWLIIVVVGHYVVVRHC